MKGRILSIHDPAYHYVDMALNRQLIRSLTIEEFTPDETDARAGLEHHLRYTIDLVVIINGVEFNAHEVLPPIWTGQQNDDWRVEDEFRRALISISKKIGKWITFEDGEYPEYNGEEIPIPF